MKLLKIPLSEFGIHGIPCVLYAIIFTFTVSLLTGASALASGVIMFAADSR